MRMDDRRIELEEITIAFRWDLPSNDRYHYDLSITKPLTVEQERVILDMISQMKQGKRPNLDPLTVAYRKD